MERLREGHLRLQFGPFAFQLLANSDLVGETIQTLYADFPSDNVCEFIDFQISATKRGTPWGRWLPGVSILSNGRSIYGRIPERNLIPNLEWCFNWSIWHYALDYLSVHSAVLARDGQALLLVGASGAGKSTLCAALANTGWRLLSDEIALIDLETAQLRGLARPVILKNDSIEIIRSSWPDAVFSPVAEGTRRGRIGHMRPPRESVAEMDRPAEPAWICFPVYRPENGAPCQEEIDPGRALMALADQSFNYRVLGGAGFRAVGRIVEKSRCFKYEYHDLDQALSHFASL